MATIPDALNTALQHHQAGRLQEAEALYRQILQAQPDHPDTLHLLGVIAHQVGKHEVAVQYISQAIAVRPEVGEFHNNLGEAYRALGKFEEAIVSYRRALGFKPDYPEAYNNLGIALQAQGKFEDAVAAYRQALTLNPDFAGVYVNWGATLQEQGKNEEAVIHYRKAISLKPAFAEAYYNLGKVLQEQGKMDEAVVAYRQALALKPTYVKAYTNLGAALHEMGYLEEAIAAHGQALKHDPAFAEAYANLGAALQEQGKLQDAVVAYRQAIAVKPTYADAYSKLGYALKEQGKTDEAVEAYQQALALQPNDGTRIKLATILPVILGSKRELTAFRRNFEKNVQTLLKEKLTIIDPIREIGQTNFYLAYQGLDDRKLQVAMAKLYERACPSLLYTSPHCVSPERKRATDKIKIGFVSRFFTAHSVAKSFKGVFSHLPRERFMVCAILVSPTSNDETTKTFRECADATIVLSGGLSAARERIASEKLDVLFYTDIGMEPFTYFLAFSRLAPVQCVAGGHPATTGIRNLDYYISCEDLEPEGAEDHYSERLVRLKGLPVYYYRPEQSPSSKSRRDFGLEEGRTIYLCPQSLFKVHPDFDEFVGALLQADKNGLVVFVEGHVRHWTELLMRRFRETIPKIVDRIRFLPRQSYADFLRLLAIADVLLDTVHFGGGTTTFEGLAYGTPIVTLPGQFPGGRVAYACYRQMGMMDCVAASKAGYVKLAVRLGTDPAFRERVKAKIFANNHVLYENLDGVREYEQFFLRVIKQAPSQKKGKA